MDDDAKIEPDLLLRGLAKQDLYDLSAEDLRARIAALKAEIDRCEALVGERDSSRNAAEAFFKS